MPSIDPEVREPRSNDQSQTWRIMYAMEDDAIVCDRDSRRVFQEEQGDAEEGGSGMSGSARDVPVSVGRERMDSEKRKKLKAAGWEVGEVEDFLELSPEEVKFIETKISLARGLREERERQGLTQEEVARRIGSSQSRVAKMEAADQSVSVDLLVRSLLKLGIERDELGKMIGRKRPRSRSRTKVG